MRQATTNFQLNVDNIPVVVSNNCLKKKKKRRKKERKKEKKENPGADRWCYSMELISAACILSSVSLANAFIKKPF